MSNSFVQVPPDSTGKQIATNVIDDKEYQVVNIADTITSRTARIDSSGKLLVAQMKRMVGANSITNPTLGISLFSDVVAGSGTNTNTNGVSSLATGTTANSSVITTTVNSARFQFGRVNLWRGIMRFGDTGTANNVRQFGLFVDANNSIGYRLSGTTFSIFHKKAGTETVIASGSFNGRSPTYAVDTNFHGFEIEYFAQNIRFVIDGVPIHTLTTTTTSFISNLVCKGFFSNVNSGGSTSNVLLGSMGFGIFQYGSSVSNPQFYNMNAVAETRVLKGGGGTLHSVSITRSGGVGATITIYDNTAASGAVIGVWDLNRAESVGNFQFGPEGVNFTNGLTYITSGALTGASVTITWD